MIKVAALAPVMYTIVPGLLSEEGAPKRFGGHVDSDYRMEFPGYFDPLDYQTVQ